MFEPVTTNAAGLLTIILLWSTLVWLSTYMYMSEKIRREKETVRFLDDYMDLCERDLRAVTERNRIMEEQFGDAIDDYIDQYYADGSWKRMKWEV